MWHAEFRDRGFAKTFYLLEEMTEELRLTEKTAYEKLIRMMSHEVNNSVGAVRSLLESVLRYAEQIGPDDRGDFTNALTIAAARIESLNRFMSGFADVVRLPPPHPRDVIARRGHRRHRHAAASGARSAPHRACASTSRATPSSASIRASSSRSSST